MPRKEGERRQIFHQLRHDGRTLIFFESPRRLAETLVDMATEFGADRQAAVARELTKTFEEVQRGCLGELAQWAQQDVKGEISIVVEGDSQSAQSGTVGQDVIDDVRELVDLGVRLKDAAGYVAGRSGLRKNQVYQAVVALSAE